MGGQRDVHWYSPCPIAVDVLKVFYPQKNISSNPHKYHTIRYKDMTWSFGTLMLIMIILC